MTRKPQLPALTGLRFVAALWVLSLHLLQIELGARGVTRLAASGVAGRLEDAVSRGSAGVTLFFVLSGFILTYTYWDVARQTPIDRRGFWRARFGRVYPVYALGLLVGFGPWLATIDWHRYAPLVTAEKVGGVFGATVLLLQSWIPRMAHRWNSVGWSLSNEAFFYAVFPFLIAPLARLRPRTLLVVAGGVYAFAIAAATLATTPFGAAHDLAGYVYFHPLYRVTDFVVGVIAGLLFLGAGRDAAPGWASRAVLLSGGVALAVLLVSRSLPPVLVDNALLAPVFAIAIYALAWGRGRIARLLATRPLIALGEASYALYILHLLLLRFAFGAVSGRAVALSWWFAASTVAGAVAVSLAVFRWYEEPARRRLRGTPRRDATEPRLLVVGAAPALPKATA